MILHAVVKKTTALVDGSRWLRFDTHRSNRVRLLLGVEPEISQANNVSCRVEVDSDPRTRQQTQSDLGDAARLAATEDCQRADRSAVDLDRQSRPLVL